MKKIIGIGAPVKVPRGSGVASCSQCGARHNIQDSTAKMIAEVGDSFTVLCWECLKGMELPAFDLMGVTEGRERMGL